jgi:hypothetical protein
LTSPWWLLVELIYIGGSLVLLGVAFRSQNGWMKAGLAAFGLAMISWRLLAVIPSWWLYYADGVLRWGGQGCTEIDGQCLKQAAKDIVVVVENGMVLGAVVVAFMLWQKRFPKQLAAGEKKPEATGGYK